MKNLHIQQKGRSLALVLLVATASTARADDRCDAPADTWQPRSAVHALAQRNGWQVQRLKIDDGCYEIKGRDAEGRAFKAKLDPATLRVIALKRANGDKERERERSRDPASTPAPGRAPA